MDITATFQLTRSEFVSALRHVPAMRRSRAVFALFILVGVGLVATGRHNGYYFAFGGAVSPLVVEFALRRSAKRSAALLAGPWTVHINDETYRLRTPVSQADVDWSAYAEVVDRSGFWYLQQPNRAVSFLPQRAFDGMQREQLAAFFATRLPAGKRRWYQL